MIFMPKAEKNVAIIICERYHTCAGGKCLRALRNREGAFSLYKDVEVKLVGYTTCGGCPGGNVEYCVEEMNKNGVAAIHLATGMLVGFPPCPYIGQFHNFIKHKYNVDVVFGTHPIPQKYFLVHQALKTWDSPEWKDRIRRVLTDEQTRLRYC